MKRKNNIIQKCLVLLCIVTLLPILVFRVEATAVTDWTNGDLGLSYETNSGSYADGWGENASVSASWSYSAADGSLTGTVTPGSKFKTVLVATWYYPASEASTVLTLTNNMESDALLTFSYTESGNQGTVTVSGADKVENGNVTATLSPTESVTVTVTTKKNPASSKNTDNRASYMADTKITSLSLTEIVSEVDVELAAVTAGGSYTATADGVGIDVGQTHTDMPVETVYSFTAAPLPNYQFDGWYFNGVKQNNTSYTLSNVTFGKNTKVEARFIVDPIYSITTATGDKGKEDLVIIDSRFIHSSSTEYIKATRADNVDSCYYSVSSSENANVKWHTQLVPWLQWTVSDTSVTISSSGKATGEQESNGARSWAYANMLSDVVRIYAKEDCIVKFDYSNNCYGGADTTSDDSTIVGNLPYLHVYESTSGAETLSAILARGKAYEDNKASTSSQAETRGSLTYSLAKGKYLYIYSNALMRGSTTILLGSGSHTMDYRYNASLSNVSVQYNNVYCAQNTKIQDNTGAGLATGKVTANGVTYATDASGNLVDASGNAVSLSYLFGQRVALSATAPTNYRLLGWNVDGTMVYTSTYEYQILEERTYEIHPVFVPNRVTYDASAGTYTYLDTAGATQNLNGQYIARNHDNSAHYTSLADAFAADGEVILLGNMTIEGDLTIESGETLVVPCAMGTVFTRDNSGMYHPIANTTYASVSEYATLTVNGNMTVNGSLLLSGNQYASSGAHACVQSGMTINSGKRVTVGATGALYAYGYVNGSGTIYANGSSDGSSGAKIHEFCDIVAVPHPMAMQGLVQSHNVMPLNSYYLYSIRVPTKYAPGATLLGHTSLAYDVITQVTLPIIAPKNCVFTVTSGTVTKSVDTATGKIVFRVDEGSVARSNSFTLSITATLGTSYTMELDSADVCIPLSNAWRVEVAGTMNVQHGFKFLPGATLDIKSTGTIEVKDNGYLVFYRLNDYDYRYNSSLDSETLGYSVLGYPINISGLPGVTIDTVGSARLNVDGTLITNGKVYVTEDPIDAHTESDTKYAYKNYVVRDNGYNLLTGSGTIVAAEGSGSTIKEHVTHATNHSANVTEVTIVPLKGLNPEATADEVAQYDTLSGTYEGVTNANSLNVWCNHSYEETSNTATCIVPGVKTLTCTLCANIKTEESTALGHTYALTSVNFSEDGTTYTVTVTCSVCEEGTEGHSKISESQNATVSGTNAGDCQTNSTTTYSATGEFEGVAYSDTKTVEGDKGDHSYGEGVVTAPTCTAGGYTTYTCQVDGCTHSYTGDETEKLDHTDANNDGDHICDRDGCSEAVSTCADTDKNHSCDSDSACTVYSTGGNAHVDSSGDKDHVCDYCGEAASECSFTEKGDVVTVANCVTKAVYGAKCSICGAVSDTVTIEGEVDSTKHTGNTVIRNEKAATCAAEGYTGDTYCSDCNTKIQDGTTTAKLTTHSYPETWTQTKAPTCTEKGSEERVCTVEGCGSTQTQEIEALGHVWATTLTKGDTTHWYDCSRCEETKDVAEHSYTWTVTKEANCYQAGSKSGVCACGATATEEIAATGQHMYSNDYTTVADNHWRACTTEGCTAKTDEAVCSGGTATCTTPATCAVCGESYGTVAEAAHNWGEWKVTTPATCTAEGEETRTCSYNSAHTETKVVEKAEHVMTHHVRVEATCVAAGNVEYWSCSGCGQNYSDENGTTKLDSVDIAIDSDAHDLKNVAAQSATCTQIGWDAYQKCQREGCNYSTYVEIPKLNHTDADNDGDHLCDTDGCSEVVTTCEDTGKDHICDSDSACNIYSTGNNAHVDSGKDHECDYGCNVSIGECKDGDDADHKCDYGCGKDNLTDHNYGTEWKHDTANHWHECICGDKADVTAHTYSSEETKAATCTEAGEMTYTCVCGHSYTEKIEAAGHRNTVTSNEKAATCGTAGYTGDTFCTDCETIIKEGETIGATGNHSYTTKASTSVKSEATCKDVAVYWAQCDNCTAVSETVAVNGTEKAPDNHVGGTEEIAEVPATCQTAGTTAGTKCLGCNTVITGCTEIPKLECADTDNNHICNNGCDQELSKCADNDTNHECDVCGAAMGTHEAAEGKHTCDYCGETVTQCDDGDDADHNCDVCGKMVGSHTYGTEWKYDTTSHWHECACGEKSGLDVHSYDNGVVTKEPTTEAEGEMTYTCKCGYSYTETIDKLVPQGYTVKIVNYTANDANLATVTIDGNAVEYQKKVAVEAKLGVDGAFAVSCKWGCLVAYSTDGTNFEYLPATKDETADSTYNFFVPQIENVQIHVLHKGDANKNGTVNATDLSMLKKYMLNDTLSGLVEKLGDANGNGITNATDLSMLKKLLLTEAYLTKW